MKTGEPLARREPS